MAYVIDYRNGSMGHTILAHALVACEVIDIDIDAIFSHLSDAHAISQFNTSQLQSIHALEETARLNCNDTVILHIVANYWDDVLRTIMSYNKWYKNFPNPDNLEIFNYHCPANMLPLEFLTLAYYDSDFSNKLPATQPEFLPLGAYLNYEIEPLKSCVKKYLGWSWNEYKSKIFHNLVLEKNLTYIAEQQRLQTWVAHTCQNITQVGKLDFWQKAIVICMACIEKNLHPSMLHWNDFVFLSESNQTLIESIEKVQAQQKIDNYTLDVYN